MIVWRNAFRTDFASQRCETQVSGSEVSSFLLELTSVEYSQDLAGILVGNIRNELKTVRKGVDDEAIITAESLALKLDFPRCTVVAYNVKGPFTRSNRTLPVLMIINLGTSARDSLITVAAKAVASKGKILPSAPNGLQYWQ